MSSTEIDHRHKWERDEDDEVDIFAFAAGFHNGPRCARCGTEFCHHCDPDCYDKPCHMSTPTGSSSEAR